MGRVKRTYNLSPEVVLLVQDMAGDVAPTQDLVVERSIRELSRRVRDREHTRLWTAAAADPQFAREMDELFTHFDADDRAAWDG